MRKPGSVSALEDLGRVRLSENFFMRDMLYSEIANTYGIPNIPDDPDLAVAAGTRLCQDLLEPIWAKLGRISIRSAFRSSTVNERGKEHKCASNERNYAAHIWDQRDAQGFMGATACIVVHAFIPYYERTKRWETLAWWIHDSGIPYDRMSFFPKLAAFNIRWHERPERCIYSQVPPRRGWLTKPGMDNFEGSHEYEYRDWLREVGVGSVNIDKIIGSIPGMSQQERDRVHAHAQIWTESGNAVQKQAAEKVLAALEKTAEAEHQAIADRLNGMEISARVVEAFRVSPMSETEAKVIQVLLDRPGSTSSELSQALGWGAQSWHMHFGTMCYNRAVYLWPAPKSEVRSADFYSGILADLSPDNRWTMKPEVEVALSELGLRGKV